LGSNQPSTREPGEGAGLLSNGSISDKRVGAFDVEFEYEDDVLLNWQHTRYVWCSWAGTNSGWRFETQLAFDMRGSPTKQLSTVQMHPPPNGNFIQQ
jgi:hypothetical protein